MPFPPFAFPRSDSPRIQRRSTPLVVEALEDRCLLSTTAGPAVVFLGDSILDHYARGSGAALWNTQIAPLQAADLAVSGSTTQGVLARIEQGQLNGLSPRVVVLLIGTNDLALGASPQQAAAGIAGDVAAIEAHVPGAQILLLGLLPRGQSPGDPLRAAIAQTNTLIAPLGTLRNVTYAEFGAAFLQPDGTISPTVLYDYLHPSATGCALLTANLQAPIHELLNSVPAPAPILPVSPPLPVAVVHPVIQVVRTVSPSLKPVAGIDVTDARPLFVGLQTAAALYLAVSTGQPAHASSSAPATIRVGVDQLFASAEKGDFSLAVAEVRTPSERTATEWWAIMEGTDQAPFQVDGKGNATAHL
jgi:beta-glucosidase